MDHDKKKFIKDLVFGLTLASEVVGSFMIAVIGGLYIDNYCHTQPIFILIFLVMAFIHVIRILLRVGRK